MINWQRRLDEERTARLQHERALARAAEREKYLQGQIGNFWQALIACLTTASLESSLRAIEADSLRIMREFEERQVGHICVLVALIGTDRLGDARAAA